MKGWTWRHAALALAAFLIIAAAVQASGVPGGKILETLSGTLGSGVGWRNVLAKGTPLLMGGLAVFIALRAGLLNIGAEGQMLVGGLAAVSINLALPNPAGLILGLAAGICAGALWAFPAGWIKAHRGGHEVISTIMLNWVARFFAAWLVKGVMSDPTDPSGTTSHTAPSAWLPDVLVAGAFRMNLAFVIALAVLAGAAVWLTRTVSGYEVEAVGANREAAEAAGIPVRKVIVRAMSLSGGLSGLAGAMLVAALDHRLYPDLAGGAGFDSLGVALLAGPAPLLALPSAIFFALVDVGTSSLSFVGLPKGLSGLLLGLVILVFAAHLYRRRRA